MSRDPPFGESAFFQSIVVELSHPTDAGEARRQVTALGRELNLDETDSGRLAIIATELAMNVVLHGNGGELVCRAIHGPVACVELLAIDKGPGMADYPRYLRDGFSTGGTAGAGLGAITRLATEVDVFTATGQGTVMLARLRSERGTPLLSQFQFGAICVPKPGEDVCGDSWLCQETPDGLLMAIVDGLGHGPVAAEAASTALAVLRRALDKPFTVASMIAFLDNAHNALRATRGAAMSLALIDSHRHELQFLGVGNVMGAVHSDGQGKGLVPRNGTLGLSMRPAPPFSYGWPSDGLLLMYSDGLTSGVRLDRYPGLTRNDPAVIAGVLYRDFRRGTDDVTVAVARATTPSQAGPG